MFPLVTQTTMTLKEAIRETSEYQDIAEPPGAGTDADATETRRVESADAAVAPIISLERSDVQFWIQVIQVLLLYLILRELGRP